MLSWVRWSGLFVFSLVILLLFLVWLAVAPWVVKWSLESAGEKAFGAKVEVGSVDLSLSPLGFSLFEVSIADKNKPMRNIASFEQASARLEVMPLMMSKLIIPEFSVAGLRVGDKRPESGALASDTDGSPDAHERENKALAADSAVKKVRLPTVEEVLAKEPLKTLELADSFKQRYENTKRDVDNTVEGLPNSQKVKEYEIELKSIVKGKIKSVADFQERKERFDRLRAEIRQRAKELDAARQKLQAGVGKLQDDFTALQAAPEEDLAYLRSKYSLDGGGLSNMAMLLAGGETGAWVSDAVRYYQMVQPMLESDKGTADGRSADYLEKTKPDVEAQSELAINDGRYIHFESDRPLPDFWIKSLVLRYVDDDVQKGENLFNIEVRNIARQQDLTGQPIDFLVESDRSQNRDLRAVGVLDRRNGRSKDSVDINMRRWPLGELDLGSNGLSLASSALDADIEVVLDEGGLDAALKSDIHDAEFALREQNNELSSTLFGLLQGVTQFSLNAAAAGSMANPSVSISSDLDQQLSGAFKKRVDQEMKALGDKINAELMRRLGSSSSDYEGFMSEMNATDSELDQSADALEKLLEQKMDSFTSKQADKLKNKLDEKLRDLF